jgi:hypothetical protein
MAPPRCTASCAGASAGPDPTRRWWWAGRSRGCSARRGSSRCTSSTSAGVLVATAPGELTARAALALEAVRAGVPTLPLSYCGDYAGYLTTPEEYDLQRYEGASTLWGRDTLARLLAAHAALA